MQYIDKENKTYRHGGDIYNNNVLYDFSVNTNPLGMPPLVKQKLAESIGLFGRYPDIRCGRLREVIAEKENIPKENILCGNGASEIFKLVADAIKPHKALVTAPAFSGYEYVLKMAKTKVEYYYLKEEKNFVTDLDILDKIPKDCDLVFLCSPCNPTGRIIDKKIFLEVLSYCESKNIYLVADECFLGFVPDYETLSMKSEIQSNYLIIVNAFTKLYAMAGLRLGFCACGNKKLLAKMQKVQPEWSVSVPAQIAGIYALCDKDYIEKTRKLIIQERAKMAAFLESQGIKVFPSDANFLLLKSRHNLYKELLAKQVLIRDCSNFNGLGEGFYRIAVRSVEENNVFRDCFVGYVT